MTNRFARGHRDQNEPEITAILRQYGIPYFLLSEGAGADILVMLSPMELWEVKNPARAWTMTDTEGIVKEYCEAHGITYLIIETAEAAAARIAETLEVTE